MQLSVIIVNYNVRHFLEQCLFSVQKATVKLEAEIIVVDNASDDNSPEYLRLLFPNVRLVTNRENVGFAKACNQGQKLATGKFILFLNPDTIIPEDCFLQCFSFFNVHEDAGAIGIKMLDGKGKFLKESKRSFPSPMTALYKLFGLSKIFPHSAVFSKYHLGNLDENKNHEVDVLAGAFLMVKKEVIDKVGNFDETFFMYGEDVDLSYRIQKAGYNNYYFADSSIIHFKGESTRKGSLNYVRMFYNAMSVFVRKQYGSGRAGVFSFLIHTAIWIRAVMTAIANFIRRIGLPLIDAGLILLSFWVVKYLWNEYIRTDTHYVNHLLWISFPLFTVAYLIIAYYAGLYDRKYRRPRLIRSAFIATIVLLAGYALLPEQYRFSRAIILFGTGLGFLLIAALRWMLVKTGVLTSRMEKTNQPDTIVVASSDEYKNVMELIKESERSESILGRITVDEKDENGVGYFKNLKNISNDLLFNEIIFCEGTLSFKEIINTIQKIPGRIKIRFHASGSKSIVGSDSRNVSGEALSKENGFKLNDPYNRRLKRLIDVIISMGALLTFPVQFFLVKKPMAFFGNCFSVLFWQKTWVGYSLTEKGLPYLKNGILSCDGTPTSSKKHIAEDRLKIIDKWYARDYEPQTDLKLIWREYRRLGE